MGLARNELASIFVPYKWRNGPQVSEIRPYYVGVTKDEMTVTSPLHNAIPRPGWKIPYKKLISLLGGKTKTWNALGCLTRCAARSSTSLPLKSVVSSPLVSYSKRRMKHVQEWPLIQALMIGE
jgi:hypothetical protein